MAKTMMKFSSFPFYLVLLFTISLHLLLSSATISDKSAPILVDSKLAYQAVHMVYTEKPQNEEPEAYYIRTLASVLGSEVAARDALVYSFKNAASGFAAKLSPDQVKQISKRPGVLHVVQSVKIPMQSGGESRV